MFARPQFMLYLSDEQAILYRLQGQTIASLITVSNDRQGQDALRDELQQQGLKRLKIIIDSSDEVYQLKKLPQLTGGNRRILLKTQGEHLFPEAIYHYAQLMDRRLGQQTVLFTALLKDTILTPWIDLLLSEKKAIEAIYSQTLLLSHLLKHLSLSADCLLLIHEDNRIRHYFFSQQQLRFSRLLMNVDELSIPVDIYKTRDYLLQQNLLSDLNELDTRYLSNHNNPTHFNSLSLAEWGQACGLKKITDDQPFHQLLLRYLHQHHFANHYAQTCQRRYVYHHHLRTLFYFSSVMIAFISTGLASYWGWQAYELEQERKKIAHSNQQTQASFKALPDNDLPVSLLQLKDSLKIAEQLAQQQQPLFSLKWLGGQLKQQPRFELTALTWKNKITYSRLKVLGQWQMTGHYTTDEQVVNKWMQQLRQSPNVKQLVFKLPPPKQQTSQNSMWLLELDIKVSP